MAFDPKDTGRLDIRYRIAMPVEVRQGRAWASRTTEDVSSGGLFVRDLAPPGLRQLVRLRASLPFSLGRFEANAVVTRRNPPERSGKQVVGMGLAFFALGGPERERWDRFVVEAAARCRALAESPFRAQRTDLSPPALPLHRDAPVLGVSVATLEDLFVLHSRDASRAGIFLSTEPSFELEDRVTLHVTHAESESEFWLPCVVKRVVRARFRGIAVVFADDSPKLIRAFHDFLARLIDEAEAPLE